MSRFISQKFHLSSCDSKKGISLKVTITICCELFGHYHICLIGVSNQFSDVDINSFVFEEESEDPIVTVESLSNQIVRRLSEPDDGLKSSRAESEVERIQQSSTPPRRTHIDSSCLSQSTNPSLVSDDTLEDFVTPEQSPTLVRKLATLEKTADTSPGKESITQNLNPVLQQAVNAQEFIPLANKSDYSPTKDLNLPKSPLDTRLRPNSPEFQPSGQRSVVFERDDSYDEVAIDVLNNVVACLIENPGDFDNVIDGLIEHLGHFITKEATLKRVVDIIIGKVS